MTVQDGWKLEREYVWGSGLRSMVAGSARTPSKIANHMSKTAHYFLAAFFGLALAVAAVPSAPRLGGFESLNLVKNFLLFLQMGTLGSLKLCIYRIGREV